MERLLKDAEAISGVKYDISSYADIIDAIHVIQTEMGITGTTAEEAEKTIEGSTKSTRAAWQNLLIELGKGGDVKKAMGNFTKSAQNVIRNVVPVVKNALSGIGEMVRELGPVIIEELPGLVQDLLPDLLGAVGSLMGALGRALPGLLGAVWNGARTALGTFGAWLEEQSPTLGKVFNEILNVVGRISEDIEAVLNGEKSLGDVIYGWFTDAKEKIEGVDWAATGLYIRDKILEFFKNISSKIQGYLNDAKRLIKEINWADVGQWITEKVSAAVSSIASTLKTFFEDAATAIRDIGWFELGQKIWGWIKGGFTAIGTFLHDIFLGGVNSEDANWEGIGQAIIEALKNAIKGAADLISGFLTPKDPDSANIKVFAGRLLKKINEWIATLIPTLLDAGDQILTAIAEGLTKNIPFLEGHVEVVKTVIKDILTTIIAVKAAIAALNFGGTIVKSIGNAKERLKELLDLGGQVRKAFGVGGAGGAGKAAADAAGAGGAAAKSGWLSKATNGLKALLNNPAFVFWTSVATASYEGSKIVDAMGIDRAYGKFNKMDEQYAGLMQDSNDAKISEMQDILSELRRLGDDDNFETLPDQVEEIKKILPELGPKLQELFPDNAFINNLKEILGEDFSWEDALKLDNISGEDWAQFTRDAFVDLGDKIKEAGESGAEAVGKSLQEKGLEAVKSIQTALNGLHIPGFGGFAGFALRGHASAMENGEILRGITPFGVDGSGRVHYGGEAGDEAVVGVGSLRGMIQQSVNNALGGLRLQVVLDSGVLVGEIAPQMDTALNDIATWKGGGRAG